MATKNVTLAIEEELLTQARELAERRGTTLNGMIRSYLLGEMDQAFRIARAREGLRDLMKRTRLEFEPGTDLKEISRRYEPNELHGHQRPTPGRRRHAG
jgi:hypothetical protein